MDLPNVLYRCPGQWSRPGGTYDYLGVETPEAHDKAIADGWHLTMPEAIDAYENKRDAVIAEVEAEAVTESAPQSDPVDEANKPRRGRPPKGQL